MKNTSVKNYKLWLVVSGAALVGIWYLIFVLLYFFIDKLTYDAVGELTPPLSNIIYTVIPVAVFVVASAFSTPFAYIVYKRLKIEKPLISSLAFNMAIVFGVSLFFLVMNVIPFAILLNYGQNSILAVAAISMVVSFLVFWFFIRRLKHILSSKLFLSVVIVLGFLPIIAVIIRQLLI